MRKWLSFIVASAALVAFCAEESFAAGGGKGGAGRSGGSRASGSRSSGMRSGGARSGPGTGSRSGSTSVRGHYRSDGKWVNPHQRSRPDRDISNNYSTKGNVNPYTGKRGTRVTPPKN
jgi:hypothetical protein